ALAATSYATAAQLTELDDPGKQPTVGMLWERAAQAALHNAHYPTAIEHAGRAGEYHRQRGHHRAAARAQALAGEALQIWGRHDQAREQLTAAVEVLRTDPDLD